LVVEYNIKEFYFIYNYIKNIYLLKVLFLNYYIWGLGIGDWGLGIGDWGLGPKPQPHKPQPPTPKTHTPK
jgi:hypothetical protein